MITHIYNARADESYCGEPWVEFAYEKDATCNECHKELTRRRHQE